MTDDSVTESEANSKECVQTRMMSPPVGCVGSDCMAWRWTGRERKVGDADVGEPTGYCGLAGKPSDE